MKLQKAKESPPAKADDKDSEVFKTVSYLTEFSTIEGKLMNNFSETPEPNDYKVSDTKTFLEDLQIVKKICQTSLR